MVLPNPKHTFKAQLLDYDALLAASDRECSYCLSDREVEILLSFTDYVAWHTRYISTTTPIDRELIAKWSAVLARKLMSGCCGNDQLHRFSEGGVYQSSDDDGATWFDDPAGDPRNGYVGTPPLPGEPGAGKKCAAADNVRDLFEQYRDNLIELVGTTPTILYIISGIVAFIGVLAGVSGVGIGISVLFLTMAAEMISIGGTGISGAITFTALEDFRCLVYCAMDDDGRLDYDSWQQLLADIAGHFDGFAETFFYQTVNGMGFVGVNNAATMGVATADDCDDCGCENCSNLSNWEVIYGDIVEQSPGFLRLTSTAAGANQAIRLANYAGGDNNCCAVTYDITSGVVQNQAYYPCGSGTPVFSVPPAETCMYDINVTNIFNVPFEAEFTFIECP